MKEHFYRFINLKPSELKVVRKLFLIQLFLGVATAFLFTSAITLFLHEFQIHYIPTVYLLSALLLLLANTFYSKLEEKYSSSRLLQIVIVLSALSLIVTWVAFTFIDMKGMPLFLIAWNLVIYMLVGYAFWGMAAIIFNVRESKRIFTLVGSGDLPAKLLGYSLVPLLIPYVGVNNLLWVSVCAFAGAFIVLRRFHHQEADKILLSHALEHHEKASGKPLLRIFHNKLILYVSLFSLIGFTAYALIDYTLLGEIKSRFSFSPDLAVFISVFFAIGRVLAIVFKVLLSSRVISQLGLSTSLLISPVVLLLVTSLMFIPGIDETTILYIFGAMVLLSEVLKSTVQEPAFFILFQPLNPHLRLKGHLLAKGYMLPFALLGSGLFLIACNVLWKGVSLFLIGQVLVGLLLAWTASVYLIKNEYRFTLIQSIRKGWFTGAELFLNNASVKALLLQKVHSFNPKEIVVALELLERSGYEKINSLLLELFKSEFVDVRKFTLNRLVRLEEKEVLPLVESQLQRLGSSEVRAELIKAYYYLAPVREVREQRHITIYKEEKKHALEGLLTRNDPEAWEMAIEDLDSMINKSSSQEDKFVAMDVMWCVSRNIFQEQLEMLMASSADAVCKRAIEVAGKTKSIGLLDKVVATATVRKMYHSLQKALVLFGDEVFAAGALEPQNCIKGVLMAVVMAAGKVKGELSARYLMDVLTSQSPLSGKAIVSLWQKRHELAVNDQKLVEQWVKKKVLNCHEKVQACRALRQEHRLWLLSDTLERELADDVNKLLKGLALCYERQHIDRFIKLFQLGDSSKIANAIEVLEQTLPKHLFKEVDAILDFVLDVKGRREVWSLEYDEEVEALLARIIKNEGINCTAWCRAVACFMVPELPYSSLSRVLAENGDLPKEHLFQETRNHVLSVLK